MIISVRADNFLVFSDKVEFSMKADMRTRRFQGSVFSENSFNIVKSACVFGPNNMGKTCFVRVIKCIRDAILGTTEYRDFVTNEFSDSKVCGLGISFYHKGHAYSYDFKYDTSKGRSRIRGFVYESFKELSIDQYGNSRESEIFLRDVVNGVYRLRSEDAEGIFIDAPKDKGLICSPDVLECPEMRQCADILTGFASIIDIINFADIPLEKTIKALKYNEPLKDRIVQLIKCADLGIDDYAYIGRGSETDSPQGGSGREVAPGDYLNLYSYHRGRPLQSVKFDSRGTMKFVAVAGYIADALDRGRILIIDELDNSMHFRLTRCLITLFNNGINFDAQLIFTTFDFTLMDCRKLFRKEQIWFISNIGGAATLYPLSALDGVRSDTEIFDRYRTGEFGSISDPIFTEFLSDVPIRSSTYE
ncbi:MAG: ATP-binding protein [Clostridia bacterium]|nr:ATP-binding protein [Clostridia bacterium]